MSIEEGAGDAIKDIIIGIIVSLIPIALKVFSVENAEFYIGLIDFLAIIAFIKYIEIVEEIPISTAFGYFIVTFTVGSFFMPEWERGLQIIILLVYIFGKFRK